MNMEELAKKAGVSVSTVSKSFAGSREISEEKKELIFQIARENGCYEKYWKKQHKKRYKKPVIAVIYPEFQSRYYADHLFYIEKEIRQRGGIMLASCTDFDEEYQEEMLSYFTEYAKADGIILYGELLPGKCEVPIVNIGDSGKFCTICLSNENAISDAIRYLVENGHREIAFIGEKHTAAKKEHFLEAMYKNGLRVRSEYIVETDSRFEVAGYEAMNQLFTLKKLPTAILAAYDNIAIGAIKNIYEHGMKIPEDISIIGMDDIKEGASLTVPLTSITTYNEDWCQVIVDTLFEQMKSCQSSRTKSIRLSAELVKRESVGKASEEKEKAQI